MTTIFLKLLEMSLLASFIVLAVLLLRLILRKVPKWIFVVMWGIVLIRLVCPFSIESPVGLMPNSESIQIDSGIENTIKIPYLSLPNNENINNNQSANNSIVQDKASNDVEVYSHQIKWINIASVIWISGASMLLIYMIVTYVGIKRKVRTAVALKDNIYQSENVDSPFVLGIIKPKIYLPFKLNEQDMENVIAHEKAHIKRKDYLWKPIGFVMLAVHWFNPLIWISYILLCRDIEAACDEKVIKDYTVEQKADYSQALLSCSVKNKRISACPLAFGEGSVKKRVKSVLNYKKPAFWVIVVAIILCVVLAVCFLTSRKNDSEKKNVGNGDTNKNVIYESDIFTDFEGVYLSVKSIETAENGDKILNLIWHNDTSEEMIFGEMYTIEYKDGNEWKDVSVGDIYFNEIANLLGPKSEINKSYTTEQFDISKDGTYRLISGFNDSKGNKYSTWVQFNVVTKTDEKYAEVNNENAFYIDELREKYPMYFDKPKGKGLGIYIWQMAENTYSCGLLPNTNLGYTQEQLFELHKYPASIEEMRAIVASYNVSKDDVVIIGITMPHSSYHYEVGQEYNERLTELFWKGFSLIVPEYTAVIDSAKFDIDNDGIEEDCCISYGHTSGLFSFVFTVSENGETEYKNSFVSSFMKLKFEENQDGKMMLFGDDGVNQRYMSMEIVDGNIVIYSDEQDVILMGISKM